MHHLQPVPTYKDYTYNQDLDSIENDKWSYNTLNDEIPENASFNWEITENASGIMVKDNIVNKNTIEIATLSSAVNDQIKIQLIYSENIII